MNLTRDRVRSIGWAFVLTVCAALTAALTLRVNAVRSEVYKSEDRIVALQHEIGFLETEFQTRANQQQLKALNDVEFGYTAPRAEQYIEGERQLAALGKPAGPGAPKPVRFAAADLAADGAASDGGTAGGTRIMKMVSPITGIISDTASGKVQADKPEAASVKADLSSRLARIEMPEAE
ncbi:MAG TPA: hypothetical protein VJM34_13295 [Novosphingobium sp.]|nr:hypothetical protein [Novosphingobium sp.]